MVRVRVGVMVLVIVVVGLAGGVQEGRGVVEGVTGIAIVLLNVGDRVAVPAGGDDSGISMRLDTYRVSATKKTIIDSPRMPSMIGRAYRGEDEGVAMTGFAESGNNLAKGGEDSRDSLFW
jgi:hypothetical protein